MMARGSMFRQTLLLLLLSLACMVIAGAAGAAMPAAAEATAGHKSKEVATAATQSGVAPQTADAADKREDKTLARLRRQMGLSMLFRPKFHRGRGKPSQTEHPAPSYPKEHNVDACKHYPCLDNDNSEAVCTDKGGDAPNSPEGRTCSCLTPNHVYQDDLLGCMDVDACKKHPCAKGDVAALCKDRPGKAPDSAAGRTCSCPPGYVYINDLSGCVDTFECISNSWSDLCANPCSAAPQLNHGSFPSKCKGPGVSKGNICIGMCDKGWKVTYPAPTATCTSAGWIVKGTCEADGKPDHRPEQQVVHKPEQKYVHKPEHKPEPKPEPYKKPKEQQDSPSADDFFEGVLPSKPGKYIDSGSDSEQADGQYSTKHGDEDQHAKQSYEYKQARKQRHKQKKQRHDRHTKHDVEDELETLINADPRLKQWLLKKRADATEQKKTYQHDQHPNKHDIDDTKEFEDADSGYEVLPDEDEQQDYVKEHTDKKAPATDNKQSPDKQTEKPTAPADDEEQQDYIKQHKKAPAEEYKHKQAPQQQPKKYTAPKTTAPKTPEYKKYSSKGEEEEEYEIIEIEVDADGNELYPEDAESEVEYEVEEEAPAPAPKVKAVEPAPQEGKQQQQQQMKKKQDTAAAKEKQPAIKEVKQAKEPQQPQKPAKAPASEKQSSGKSDASNGGKSDPSSSDSKSQKQQHKQQQQQQQQKGSSSVKKETPAPAPAQKAKAVEPAPKAAADKPKQQQQQQQQQEEEEEVEEEVVEVVEEEEVPQTNPAKKPKPNKPATHSKQTDTPKQQQQPQQQQQQQPQQQQQQQQPKEVQGGSKKGAQEKKEPAAAAPAIPPQADKADKPAAKSDKQSSKQQDKPAADKAPPQQSDKPAAKSAPATQQQQQQQQQAGEQAKQVPAKQPEQQATDKPASNNKVPSDKAVPIPVDAKQPPKQQAKAVPTDSSDSEEDQEDVEYVWVEEDAAADTESTTESADEDSDEDDEDQDSSSSSSSSSGQAKAAPNQPVQTPIPSTQEPAIVPKAAAGTPAGTAARAASRQDRAVGTATRPTTMKKLQQQQQGRRDKAQVAADDQAQLMAALPPHTPLPPHLSSPQKTATPVAAQQPTQQAAQPKPQLTQPAPTVVPPTPAAAPAAAPGAQEVRSGSANTFNQQKPEEGMLKLLLQFGIGRGKQIINEDEEKRYLMAQQAGMLLTEGLDESTLSALGANAAPTAAPGTAPTVAATPAPAPAPLPALSDDYLMSVKNDVTLSSDADSASESSDESASSPNEATKADESRNVKRIKIKQEREPHAREEQAVKTASAAPSAVETRPTIPDVRRVVAKIAEGLLDATEAESEDNTEGASSATADAVRKSWSRSLLATDSSGFGGLFAPSPSESTTAGTGTVATAAESSDSITLENLPDLDAIGNLLDKLEGKVATVASTSSATAGMTLSDAAKSAGTPAKAAGSYRGEDASSDAEVDAETLSKQHKIRKHKHHHIHEDSTHHAPDNHQYPAAPPYKMTPPKPGHSNVRGDEYSSSHHDGYAPPPKPEYREAPPPYSQQYNPPPEQHYSPQKQYNAPPEQQYDRPQKQFEQYNESPAYAPQPNPDSYDAYKPKRLQRTWDRQYPDQAPNPAPNGYGSSDGPEGADAGYGSLGPGGPGYSGSGPKDSNAQGPKYGGNLIDDAQSLLDSASEALSGPGKGHGHGQHGYSDEPHRPSHGHDDYQQQHEKHHGSDSYNDQPQKFKPHREEGAEYPKPSRGHYVEGTSGPALVLVTNTAREKAGSVTVCQWEHGQLDSCMISMIPMFKINGKNSYPQPTGMALQQDPNGHVRLWIVDGTRNPAMICHLAGLEVVNCEEHKYKGYGDGLFDARQVAVSGNVAFILAWDKGCVVQCLDAKGLSQCSCILGQEYHGIYPAGLTVSGNKLYVAHNTGTQAGVMTCDFGPEGVNECIRSPDLPLNVDGGMLVHEGRMYMSFTDHHANDVSERGGIIVCDNADHIRPNTCRYSTGKIPARGGILGLAVHDGVMFIPQHVRSQELSICATVTDTDVTDCQSVSTTDIDERVAFRSPCAVAVLPVHGEMPQPPKVVDEETSKIDLLKNY